MWSELRDSRMYPEGLVCHSNKTENMNSVQSWHFTRWQIFHFLQFQRKTKVQYLDNIYMNNIYIYMHTYIHSLPNQNKPAINIKIGDNWAKFIRCLSLREIITSVS